MTKNLNIEPVVLCGCSGARLWPLSRSGFPQQFLCMTGTERLSQQAAQRLLDLETENLQIANADHIDWQGLFVGNHGYPIREVISALRYI